MAYFCFDGSFTGFLCALIAAADDTAPVEGLITDEEAEMLLLGDFIHTASSTDTAEHTAREIRKYSEISYRNILYAYLSETEQAGLTALRYYRALKKYGRSCDAHLADSAVLDMITCTKKVAGEQHRMLGLLRFSHTAEGIYYAPYEPDYNITALVAGHFAGRMADQDWIIHDIRRGIAAVYRKKERRYEIVSGSLAHDIELTPEEIAYRELWRSFYKSIAIKERKNPAQQKRCMPRRYWKHLTEKN